MADTRDMRTGLPRRPREITGRMVLAGFIAFFGVIVVVNMVMARFAVTTFRGVEVDSSYRAGLAFKGEEQRAALQAARHWKVDAHMETLGGDERTLDVRAVDAEGRPLSLMEGRARLARPTDASKDVAAKLVPLGDGRYRARIVAEPGQWTLILDFTQGSEQVFRSRNRVQLP